MIPVAPAQNTFRALISMNKLIMARKTRDVMSAAAPVATISAVSGCSEERNVVKSLESDAEHHIHVYPVFEQRQIKEIDKLFPKKICIESQSCH